jgi:sec-independent protein translocase protein TatB
MFDVGFSELLMVGLVALLVIGPERLPKAARIAGYWLGKARSTVANVKAEIKQELHAEEMRQLLQQQSIAPDLQKIAEETHSAMEDIKTSLTKNVENHSDNDKSA